MLCWLSSQHTIFTTLHISKYNGEKNKHETATTITMSEIRKCAFYRVPTRYAVIHSNITLCSLFIHMHTMGVYILSFESKNNVQFSLNKNENILFYFFSKNTTLNKRTLNIDYLVNFIFKLILFVIIYLFTFNYML